MNGVIQEKYNAVSTHLVSAFGLQSLSCTLKQVLCVSRPSRIPYHDQVLGTTFIWQSREFLCGLVLASQFLAGA